MVQKFAGKNKKYPIINELDPFGGWKNFKDGYELEIKQTQMQDWIQCRNENAASFLQGNFFSNMSAYPCLWGVFWWHSRAIEFGISSRLIRKTMNRVMLDDQPKVNESFSKQMSQIFSVPRAGDKSNLSKSDFKTNNFPTALKAWNYCLACLDLLGTPFFEPPVKNKGRTIGEEIFANSISRRITLPGRVKSYASSVRVSWTDEQKNKVSLFLEQMIRHCVLEIAIRYNLPPCTHPDIDVLESAIEICGQQIFGNAPPEEAFSNRRSEELRSLSDFLVAAIEDNLKERKIKQST